MKYIIRANNYNYNDENYFIETAGKIENVYNTYEEAVKVCNELNAEAIADYDRLNDFIYNSANEEVNMAWLRQYYFDNFRIKLGEEDTYLEEDVVLPDTATTEQIATILNRMGIAFFQVYEHNDYSPLVELQLNPKFWGEDAYIITEPANRSFYFNEEEALSYLMESFNNELYETTQGLKGSLEHLSSTPEILKAFLDKSETLMYNEEEECICFKQDKYETTIAEFTGLADLLKVKPYEIALYSMHDAVELSARPIEHKPAYLPPPPSAAPDKKWWQFWK